MGKLFGGGGDNGSNDEALRLQRDTIANNDRQLQQKVAAFTAQRINVIKAQGNGTYNDRTINT